jgi:hypothetical protein
MSYVMLILLMYVVLVCLTCKVVTERCLPPERWGGGLTGNDCVAKHALIRSTAIPLMSCHDTVDCIGSCCRFWVDRIISYCLRTDTKLFQEIYVSFLDKM